MANSKVLDLSKCNSSFGLDLFKKLAAEKKDENIFFSPYSISCALAMTSLGAKNDTLQQLRSALKVNSIPEQDVHKLFSELNESILGNSSECTLHVANRLYGEKSYKFKKEFLQDCTKFYGTELAAVDFRNSTAGAVKIMNEWVYSCTNGKIKDLLNVDNVNSLTTLILVNAVYFKGDWQLKFDPKSTKEDDFHINDSKKVKVQMMFMRKTKLLYGEDDDLCCQILELPYLGNSLSMVILLPDLVRTSLKEMESKLTPEILQNLSVKSKEVFAWLPRFKLESDFHLKEKLQAMGVEDLFEANCADLSGIDGEKDLYVTSAIHKAFIEVNEEGSEAAAATAVTISLRCAMPMTTPEFRADHPFIFFIQDCETKTILFHGRLIKPNNSPGCEKEINKWVSKETNDKIKDLISPGSLSSETKLVLANAIYFKGDWKNKFPFHMTNERDFHISLNNSVKMKMMQNMESFLNYGVSNRLHCQVLELPYESSVSMFILLPDIQKTTLEELESSLTSEDLQEIVVEAQLVNVWMPHFSMEQDLELSDILIRSGATDAFIVGKSDFSGMEDSKGIEISMILHKAFIRVNEQGTEAAAATAVVMDECCLMFSKKPVDFRADHPFVYFLKDNATKSILFLGRFTKP